MREYDIISVQSSVCARTSVILAGKHDSRRLSTTSFSENVSVTEISYQMLEVLSVTPFNKNMRANFYRKKRYNKAFCGIYFLSVLVAAPLYSNLKISNKYQLNTSWGQSSVDYSNT